MTNTDGWRLVPVKLTEEMEGVAARIADGPFISAQEHWDQMLNAAPASPCPENGQLRKLVEEVVNVAASYPMRDCDLFPHALAERGWFQRAKDALALPENGQNGWRDDMENAPKDGSPFLAALNNGWVVKLYATQAVREGWRYSWWGSAERVSVPYVPSHPKDQDWCASLIATHWQPLPAPPSASKPCASEARLKGDRER